MPLYFFRIRNGRYSGASERGIELADRDAVWRELTSTCAKMVSGICRKLGQDTRWDMELLDEAKQPVFRISLASDSLHGGLPKGTASPKRQPCAGRL
jgi:hypothetical protein